jgi:hypothetical protein
MRSPARPWAVVAAILVIAGIIVVTVVCEMKL